MLQSHARVRAIFLQFFCFVFFLMQDDGHMTPKGKHRMMEERSGTA